MKDREIIQLIVAIPQGGVYKFETEPGSEIATRVTAGRLTEAIVSDLGLSGTYELYVQVPEQMLLNRLNLDTLGNVLLIPIDVEVGSIFRRGG
jgi:hypothetical protein